MDIGEYKNRVIALLTEGNATPLQLEEAASAILHCSENHGTVDEIDRAVGFTGEDI
jgi:hypothetical protein